jgi:hypothetical protein
LRRVGSTEEFEDIGRCPCGQRIGANAETCAVVHALPYCDAFMALEPDDFLEYVRKSRGIVAPGEGRPN